MSAATSPGTGLAYGLRRVCAAWGMARSSFYAMTSGQHAEQPPAKRRGPKPAISDQALLVAIEADLEASPWEGEGYRKVWARLRVCRDIRVARKRVLRLMRENNLLSPHRCRRRGGNPHDGEIITHAPNLMWGTDGVRVFTVDDGWGWIFTAVEHWNAECVGWHVCKRGDRFAALQPISMGLAGLYGSTAAGAARGLALRMDHGSQYLSDHFTNQIKFWGIQPSYAFVAEPQTNGVAERFNRTLKEQIIHGRIYRNIAELRDAVRDFVELYNAQWIVEKNGYLSPAQARQAWHAAISIRPRRVRQTCVQGTGCATPTDRQLQPRPKPLDPVNVAIAVNIFARTVIHRLVLIPGLGKPAVGLQFVAVHRTALFDVPLDDRLKRFLLNVWDNFCHHVAAAFQHSEHNRLVGGSATALTARPLPADICFVYLDDPAQRSLAIHFGHVLAKFMTHAPRRLVGHAELALKLLSWNPVAGRGEQEHRVEPLLKWCARQRKWSALHRMNVMAAVARICWHLLKAMKLTDLAALGAEGIGPKTCFEQVI